jgi:3-dehydroquinate synthase
VQSVHVRLGRGRVQEYEVLIEAGGLRARLGQCARRALAEEHPRRAAIISNPKVFGLYGAPAAQSLGDAGFSVTHFLVGDGERHKTLRTLESVLNFLSASGLERNDAVVALGGGVVCDVAGFAASVYLRGIAHIQAPTTLLAQVDAAVGGKTAVNTSRGKNLVGTFHQPRAVLIDTETLQTLSKRELTAGWCESVKQGAAGSRKLFDQTRRFLQAEGGAKKLVSSAMLERLISAQVAFKASIVRRDEREELGRADRGSRRILNFGHTTAHALEAVTNYRRFRHGEAVGYGMLVAGEISKRLGLLDVSELESLRRAVRLCGRLPRAGDLDPTEIIGALAHDKKSMGGHVKWVLLERLGHALVVDGREIAPRTLRASLNAVLRSDSAYEARMKD